MPDTEASISEEPGARKGHAGICAGAVWATGRPTAMADVSKHPEMSQVLVRVQETDGSANVETLWATPLGEDRFQLDNPLFMLTRCLGKTSFTHRLTRRRSSPRFNHCVNMESDFLLIT
jgi:hypothetical protein